MIAYRAKCTLQNNGFFLFLLTCVAKLTIKIARELQERLPSIKCFAMKALVKKRAYIYVVKPKGSV